MASIKKKKVKKARKFEGLAYFVGGFIVGLIKPLKKRNYY